MTSGARLTCLLRLVVLALYLFLIGGLAVLALYGLGIR